MFLQEGECLFSETSSHITLQAKTISQGSREKHHWRFRFCSAMSNNLLIADITQPVNISPSNSSTNERVKLMTDAYNNPVWSDRDIGDQKMVKVQEPLLFQVCMVENIWRSKLSQLDDLKVRIDPRNQRIDRLSTSKKAPNAAQAGRTSGNQLITAMDVDSDVPADLTQSAPDKSMFKLTLQDKSGAMYFAINLSPLNFLKNDGNSCILGSKAVILPGAVFNRGAFLLRDNNVVFMGGIIKQWNDGRDYKLIEYLESELQSQGLSAQSRKRKTPAS